MKIAIVVARVSMAICIVSLVLIAGASIIGQRWLYAGEILVPGAMEDLYNPEIYLIDARTGLIHNLTNHSAQDISPIWSPDGQKIIFSSNRFDEASVLLRIYIMDADGRNVRQLPFTDYSNFNPVWSPDSEWIAYVSNNFGKFTMYITNVDGTKIWPVTTTDSSRGASWIEEDDALFLIVDGASYPLKTNQHRLSGQALLQWHMEQIYSYSPDGHRALASNYFPEYISQVNVINFETGEVSELTDIPGHELQPAWSPDGQRIVFSLARQVRGEWHQNLFVKNVVTGDVHQLTFFGSDNVPQWSSDGRRIMYWSQFNGESRLCIIAVDGNNRRCPIDWDSGASWRP